MSQEHNISRRTVLRGLGASLALPFLEVMSPAVAAAESTAFPVPPSVGGWGGEIENKEAGKDSGWQVHTHGFNPLESRTSVKNS